MPGRQKLGQRLRHHGGDRAARLAACARTRATSAAGNLTVNTVVSSGTTACPPAAARCGIPVCLAHRTAEPAGQHPRRLGWRHPRIQQVRGGVDPPRELRPPTRRPARPTSDMTLPYY